MDERKLRLYQFLLKMNRLILVDVPEPYLAVLSVTADS